MTVFAANLVRRVGTALLVLPLLLAALLLGPPVLGVSIVAAAVLLGTLEFFRLLEGRGLPAQRGPGLLLTGVLFLEVARPGGAGAPLWPLAALLLLAFALLPGRDLAQTVPAAGGTLLGAVYLGGLGGTIAALRVLEPVG
ncbi:MAG TPA: hypothetical protein VKI41_08430, partial [Vicinamibacteria bacterium]|nr:hypothetical protein [Vicinamibacteria bacterium]